MPRWKALPDELDPQVGEFAGQLRRLVDRSGLSVSAVADRTGYSKTSWDRYLNGRLLAPKGAVIALAEVTGTNPVHLTTMWELAERAWSRSEMRHDMTMEAIRISQARAALGEFGPPPGTGAAVPRRHRVSRDPPAWRRWCRRSRRPPRHRTPTAPWERRGRILWRGLPGAVAERAGRPRARATGDVGGGIRGDTRGSTAGGGRRPAGRGPGVRP